MRTLSLWLALSISLFLNFACSAEPAENSTVSSPSTDSNTNIDTPVPQFADPATALAEGSKLLDNGETDKAIDALNQAVTLDPDLAEAYFKLGIAYSLTEIRDQTAETVAEATPTATPQPKSKKTQEEKSNSERAFENAVAAYKKLIKTNEEDHAAHYNLGRAYNKLNEDEDAAKSLKQAVKLMPDDTEYQTELGAILIKLAQYSEAIPPLKKALELDPENLRASELLEEAQAGKKRIDFTTVKKDNKKTTKNSPESSTSNTQMIAPDQKPEAAANKEAKPRKTP
jgi:tetratricopeptide (TPR) repeat protein